MIYAHSEADCVTGVIDWLPQPKGVSTGGNIHTSRLIPA
jgi:hypothetical protein